jgi:hypothetical protein
MVRSKFAASERNFALQATISEMLCEKGKLLEDALADASSRLSDQASVDVKQPPVRDRLLAEKLHLEQQQALSRFTQHVENCQFCSQR